MLNEERVKHMVMLADYEAKGGSEDIKISSYFKKDYINSNTLWTILWVTIAYSFCVTGIWLMIRDNITVELTSVQKLSVFILIGSIYLAIAVVYVIKARRLYRKKHAKAYHRVKKYKGNLLILEGLYEKEDNDAQVARD